ncbi:MAG: excinuclease ABC subunit UvrA [Acidobacteriota bacterium]
MDNIVLKGVAQHNLKKIDLTLPRNKFIVITGPSGSGKSSLAFDTLWAEGQRRYIECLSTYARQFIENLQKPEYETIEGLSPSIAIDQKTISHNPRSTVGTVTEINDLLRLLFSRIGIPHCPECRREIAKNTVSQIIEIVKSKFYGKKIKILSPVIKAKKGEYHVLLQRIQKKGFIRARIDGKIYDLAENIHLEKTKKHNIEILVDELTLSGVREGRFMESLKSAIDLSGGTCVVMDETNNESFYSTKLFCPYCEISLPELEPRSFSFNSPFGACKRCNGIGWLTDFDEWGDMILTDELCPECRGKRLREESLAVTINDKNIHYFSTLPITFLRKKLLELELNSKEKLIGSRILQEIDSRLEVMVEMGLGYLDLNRTAVSLSGGEAQRVRLASQISSGLRGILYVLDEPSIGLHSKDNSKLLYFLKKVKENGNTVIVVEHDEETIRYADYIVDLGPGAGEKGGYVIAIGSLENITECPNSLTGAYLKGEKFIPIPEKRRKPRGFLLIEGASEHNLKNIDVRIPLGVMVSITGVSGSGKSTLVCDILYKALSRIIYHAKERPGKYKRIVGMEAVDKVVNVDQKAIGRTPRSNPATYTEIFSTIRKLFSFVPEARIRGYREGRFSFNVKGGRCEECRGAGVKKIEMNFLPDVYVTCDRCNGRRYNRETLEIRYKGKNIYEVLEMTIDEAFEFFKNIPFLRRRLEVLKGVGLGYIKLGQSATTLSGGEAQRIKLSKELGRKGTGKTIYILDEPTTGLHFDDIKKLLNVLFQLVENGNTVIIIEHNLEIVKSSDWVIDLGPEGGDEGGYIIAEGTPEDIVKNGKSYTGIALKRVMVKKHGIQ